MLTKAQGGRFVFLPNDLAELDLTQYVVQCPIIHAGFSWLQSGNCQSFFWSAAQAGLGCRLLYQQWVFSSTVVIVNGFCSPDAS